MWIYLLVIVPFLKAENSGKFLIVFIYLSYSLRNHGFQIEISYNQPKLPLYSCWSTNGVTFADASTHNFRPGSVFVDKNNTVYVIDSYHGYVREWRDDNNTIKRAVFDFVGESWSLFVTTDGTIYVDNGESGTVEKWTVDATESTVAMYVPHSCHGLFVDILNNLYCSLASEHLIIYQSLDIDEDEPEMMVIGNGKCGSDLHMLCKPHGIFVTIKLDLYVADCENDRVQLFQLGSSTGKTIVGDMAISIIRLNCPTSVLVDLNDHLFIVDQSNNRIIRSNSNGFYCVIGCSAVAGEAPNQLRTPWTAVFDNVGNIFVADTNNARIQKFILMTNIDSM